MESFDRPPKRSRDLIKRQNAARAAGETVPTTLDEARSSETRDVKIRLISIDKGCLFTISGCQQETINEIQMLLGSKMEIFKKSEDPNGGQKFEAFLPRTSLSQACQIMRI